MHTPNIFVYAFCKKFYDKNLSVQRNYEAQFQILWEMNLNKKNLKGEIWAQKDNMQYLNCLMYTPKWRFQKHKKYLALRICVYVWMLASEKFVYSLWCIYQWYFSCLKDMDWFSFEMQTKYKNAIWSLSLSPKKIIWSSFSAPTFFAPTAVIWCSPLYRHEKSLWMIETDIFI